jgi:hypothetical protein
MAESSASITGRYHIATIVAVPPPCRCGSLSERVLSSPPAFPAQLHTPWLQVPTVTHWKRRDDDSQGHTTICSSETIRVPEQPLVETYWHPKLLRDMNLL